MSHTTHIPITARWFDHVVFGVDGDFKEDEYKQVTLHWAKRFCRFPNSLVTAFKTGDWRWVDALLELKPEKTTVTLTNGYNPNSRRAEIELLGLAIKTPNPKWVPEGTEGLYFALKLGELLRFGTVEMFKQEDQNNAS